ncbi:MAG: hypothetical protein ACC726_12015 [Chloroflexota bacterium]
MSDHKTVPVPIDPLGGLDEERRSTFAMVAGHLIPPAHGMPSAGEIVGEERLRFVLTARPDLMEPLRAALRAGIANDPATRLVWLGREEPEHLAALQLVVVAGYYTDPVVRERIGYPGQLALPVQAWKLPLYIEEGLTDQVIARGPIWRDPSTRRRA